VGLTAGLSERRNRTWYPVLVAYSPVIFCELFSFLFCGPAVLELPRPLLIEVSEPCFSTLARTPWMWKVGPSQRPLLTQDNTTQKDEDKHSRLQRGSNLRSQYQSGEDLAVTVDWRIIFLLLLL
jgi:hypothetical protein